MAACADVYSAVRFQKIIPVDGCNRAEQAPLSDLDSGIKISRFADAQLPIYGSQIDGMSATWTFGGFLSNQIGKGKPRVVLVFGCLPAFAAGDVYLNEIEVPVAIAPSFVTKMESIERQARPMQDERLFDQKGLPPRLGGLAEQSDPQEPGACLPPLIAGLRSPSASMCMLGALDTLGCA